MDQGTACRITYIKLYTVLLPLTPILFFQVNPACAAQSLVVPDLNEGQEYFFRVRAENRFGFGPYIATIQRTKARDPIRTFDFIISSIVSFCGSSKHMVITFFFYFIHRNL